MAEKAGKNRNLIVVAGPTAVGKTDLCVRLAKHFNTDVISADSRQFYREMSIGTAKPSAQEQAGVVHHFIDSHAVTDEYSAGAFEQDALALLEELFKTHDTVIVTGGSGLYIRALCEGIDAMPEVEPGIRERLVQELEEHGLPLLLEQLRALDPVYYEQVDQANPQRVVRALEVCIASGKPYSHFRQQERQERPFKIIKVGLTRERQELYTRIEQRVDQMLAQGLLEEVRSLLPYEKINALQTVGYQEVFDFLHGRQDWEETVRLLKRNTRRYAKRQLTWFNRDAEIQWFHPDDWAGILAFLQEKIQEQPRD